MSESIERLLVEPDGNDFHSDPPCAQEDERTFHALAEQWRKETGMLSSWSGKVQHPAYRAIIALGMKAVPLMLRELRDRPSHWFEALTKVVGQSPVPASDRAAPIKAREAWLKWGRERGPIE